MAFRPGHPNSSFIRAPIRQAGRRLSAWTCFAFPDAMKMPLADQQRSNRRVRWGRLRHSLVCFTLFMTTTVLAQRVQSIDLPPAAEPVLRSGFDLGGSNPGGETIAVTNRYLERGGRPYYPVVG